MSDDVNNEQTSQEENYDHDQSGDVVGSVVFEQARESIIRKGDSDENVVPLWLITFTDVMALMLTFFVLLYAMSTPQEDKWDEISASLNSQFTKEFSKPLNMGALDAVSIESIPKSRALDLGYLKTLVSALLAEKGYKDIVLFQNGDRLIVSLPSELLFEQGRAEISLEGKKMLFSLAGALSRIRNRLEIVGHSDPAPITNSAAQYQNNWELSLARSISVGNMLRNVGYERDLTMRGLSSGRYNDLPDDISQGTRYDMARRVDIVLMSDEGYRIGGYSLH